MSVEANIRFCDLIKTLQPLTGKGLSGGQQVSEVISMLTRIPDHLLGSDMDPSQVSSAETLRKMFSSDKSLTRRLANAIYQCMDLDQFIIRISEAQLPIKQQIVNNLAKYGVDVDLEKVGERCGEIALKTIARRAEVELTPNSLNRKISYASGIANNKDALLMQCAGFCMECRSSLTANNHKDNVSVYEILPIDPSEMSYGFDDFVVMCPKCAARYKCNPSKEDIERVRSEKKSFAENQDFEGLLVPLNLEKDIAQLLNDIKSLGMDETSHGECRMYEPVSVNKKVQEDYELCREITDSISSYYRFIARRMIVLEESQKISFNMLLGQMHAKYLEYG